MQKKRLSTLVAAVVLGLAGQYASAGLLDGLGKVSDTIKKASDAVQSAGSAAGNTVPGGTPAQRTGMPNGSSYQLPMGFEAYPKADLKKRIDNPYDSLTIPVVVPINGPDGYLAPYTVPVEGKVTMLQYEHRQDDSPALIMRHYLTWLSAQGFEVVTVCAAPCKALESGYNWSNVADASRRVDTNYLPSRPAYIAAYKPGAMALVGVGTHIYQFSSFVKLVEGKVGDLSNWQRVTATQPQPGTSTVGQNPQAPVGNATPQTPTAPTTTVAQKPTVPGTYADGAELVLKLKSAKLLATPAPGGKVVATLGSADGLVYMGAESGGYLQVTTAQGDGWVDKRLVKLP